MIIQKDALALSGAFGQETPPPVIPAISYQEAWDAAFSACADMIGSEECNRMMGYIPFLCPPAAQRPIYVHPLFWLALGLLAGKVFF